MKHKIAMVGFGGMAGWHYNLIKDLEELEVIVIAFYKLSDFTILYRRK